MQPAVLGAAVERFTAHETFAAREVNTALGAAHHVLFRGAIRAPARTTSDFSRVALEDPVRDRDDEYQQEKFQSAVPRFSV
jgi:hypothetical protein